MDVLLVNPAQKIPPMDFAMAFPPVPLIDLAGMIPDHHVEILDLKVENLSKSELKKKISRFDIVALTVLTPSTANALKICKIAKHSDALTVLGGAQPTLYPDLVSNPYVDIVVRGEGEITFREIVDGKDLSKINGISYTSKKKVFHNPDRTPVEDLDSLPFPRRDLLKSDRYHVFGVSLDAMDTCRGCPFKCEFCCTPPMWGQKWRAKSPERVISEIGQVDKGKEVIFFNDDNFCHDMSRVERICDLIIEHGLNGHRYGFEARADSIVKHPEIVRKMGEANFQLVVLGIESAHQNTLNQMKKGVDVEQVSKSIRILNENGIMTWGTVIIGNFNETRLDVLETIRHACRLPIDVAQFTVLTPFPGTPLHENIKDTRLLSNAKWSAYDTINPVMHTPHLSRRQINNLLVTAYAMFYLSPCMAKRYVKWLTNPRKRWVAGMFNHILPVTLKWGTQTAMHFAKQTFRYAVKPW